jgi:hypothetical protein
VKLILEAEKRVWRPGEMMTVRLLVHNDGYEPVVLDRRLLIGPNLMPASGNAPPVSVEPAFTEEARNQIFLNPWTFYGRQRSFPGQLAGPVFFYGYLLGRPGSGVLPKGPADAHALLAEAEPLMLTVE